MFILVIKRILQKLPLLLEGENICVEEYISDVQVTKECCKSDSSCTVEVSGMKATTSLQTLELYFESKRASGEDLDNVQFEYVESERVARIKYASKEGMYL